MRFSTAAAKIICLLCLTKPVPADDRTTWLYSDKGETRVYTKLASGEWLGTHPTKEPAQLKELERDANQVLLQNQSSKLIIRLTNERAYWRRPADTDWTTYFKGNWGELPDSIARTLLSSTDSAVPKKKPEDYFVRVAYFVPQDRKPVPNWEQKIQVILYYVESMFRNDLKKKQLDSDGIHFETVEGKPRIHLIRGKHPASYYNNAPAYNANKQFALLSPEIAAVIGSKQTTMGLVFAETYSEEPSDRLWKGVLALGGHYSTDGGLGIFSAHLLRDEFCATTVARQPAKFFDQTPVPGRRALGHRMNSPRCEFVEDGFGAVIHEMGHALGLPHDMRDSSRYIMSNGFRNIRRNLDRSTRREDLVTFSEWNTNLLMSSRYVNPNLDFSDNEPPKADFEPISSPRNGLLCRVKVTDNRGLRAWVISDKAQDSIIAGGKLQGKEWSQQITLPAKAESGKFQLTLIVADEGGNQTRVRMQFGAK